MITFDASGLVAGVASAVGKLTDALGESTLRATGFAGAEVFRDEAKRNASSHVKTGVLMNNIIVKRAEEASDTNKVQTYLVTVRSGKHGHAGDAYYWRWVENGHSFVRRKKKGTSWKAHRAAALLEYGSSSVPAKPFMRPAYESKKQEAIDAMNKKLAERVAQHLGGES